jgi:chromosomal replication initiator protein
MKSFLDKIPECNTLHNDFLNQYWKEFIGVIEIELGKRITDIWFRSLILIQVRHDIKKVIVKTPNKFVKEWLEKNYIPIIKKVFSRILGHSSIDLELTYEQEKKLSDPFIPATREDHIKKNPIKIKQLISRSKLITPSYLNPTFTFDNFIVGHGNDVAHAAARYIVENESIWYNPLFIYGKSGMGKSHLLQAIGNSFKTDQNVCIYQTADQFINNYIQSVKSQSIDQFEKIFDNIDIFLIDDIQSIARKEHTQEIFLKIFNTLIQFKKKIVITANDIPRNIKGLIDRIKSRLEGGLIIDLSLPSFDTLLKIIYQKAHYYKITLDPDVASYIACSNIKNIREAEGLITKLIAYSSLTKKELSSEVVGSLIDYKKSHIGSNALESKILGSITDKYSLTIEELKSNSRKKDVVLARHIAMYMLRFHAKKTYIDIANFFNRKDHTTVLHAFKKISAAVNNEKKSTKESYFVKEIEKSIIDNNLKIE